MATVTFDQVTKKFGDVFAVNSLSLQVKDEEFLVLVGPSGCGKTTALRMIAGLEEQTSGDIFIGERLVNDVAPKDRDIAMVFQNYALYPHMSVYDNMAFGLKMRKFAKDEIDKRVQGAAKTLGLEDLLKRKPRNLSGGQRQRVAMGRAIVREPAAFLMDEPLSNLDAKLRVQMRAEISRLQRDLGVTTIYVTHDQVEAMTMGDRVAVLSRGFLQQVATPQELYDSPDNLFVAGFIGSPPMNLLQAAYTRTNDGGGKLTVGSQTLGVPASVLASRPALAGYDGRTVAVGIRPEHVEDASFVEGGGEVLAGHVDVHEGLGSEVILHMTMDAPAAVDPSLRADTSAVRFLARVNPRTKLRAGDSGRLVVDTAAVHLFDVETGQAIRG